MADVKASAGSSSQSKLIAIDGLVYNIALFAKFHPGGEALLNSFAGTCCSARTWRGAFSCISCYPLPSLGFCV